MALLKPFVRRELVGGGYRRELQHPLTKLFRRPNRWQTRFEFVSYMLTSLCLRGNSFVVVERDKDANPIELVPIAPDRCTMMLTDDGELWYRINSRRLGYGLVVPPDDMIHLKNMSMDGYVGVSPIACAQDVIGLALATQQHGGILFRQGGQVGGVVKHPGQLSKEAADRIANSWRETHAGVQNAHKVAILEEGMTFDKVAITNEEAQFLETRRFQVLDIARLYGVPPHRLGELDKATLNNIEQQNQQYVDGALKPIADSIETDKRALRFTISTGSVDRERDTIAIAGWDLSNFKNNPVVLWGHDASRLPIGRAFDVAVEGGALKASVEFIPADTPEGGAFAESVYRLARGGFIAATSVGFRPLKWDYSTDKDRGADDWFPGIDFEEQELVELSIVTVPANPEALVDAPLPGEGTAIATPNPTSGEEVTAFNEEQARARARRRRVFQLAMATAD
jgi:HK97 family phage portal protein/HK97 family phage prohead protease